ncbi:MAG: hypothetical protein KAG94_03600 [Clostridiales bacterium]|nr:hypothetical protein [Clostridiales bacterium]
MGRNYYKTAFNWVAPVVVVVIILTGELFEGLTVLLAYIIFRFFDEKDKISAYYGKKAYLKGHYKKAVKLYKRAFKTNKAEPKVCISYCYSLLITGQTNKADEILSLIKNMKNIEEISSQILICEKLILYKGENRLIKAIMDLERVEQDLKNTSYHNILEKLYIENSDFKKAKIFGEQAYKYNKEDVHIIENLLRAYCLLEDYERAVKVIPILLKKKPFTDNAFYYMGLAYEKNNKLEKAEKMYKKAKEKEKTIFSYSNK